MNFPARHTLADGRAIVIRPVSEDDAPAERAFFGSLSPGTRRLRFHQWTDAVNDGLIRFYTHIDHDRHMALVCEHAGQIVGEARYVGNPGGRSCELGIVVADDWHHTGIAQLLMSALLDAARARGFRTMEGLVLRENSDMLDFVNTFGFEIQLAPEEPATVRVVKRL